MTGIIDVHSHFVPEVYKKALSKHDAMLEDGFPVPEWDAESHIQFMDRANIAYSLVALSSPHPYFGDVVESAELCRAINEEGVALMKKYPGRFGYNACLPLPDVDAAMEEAEYALDVLGATGIKLASNSCGQYLGAKEMEPLFETLNRRGTIVTIHPHRPTPQQEGIFTAGPVPLFEFICDTTRAVMNLMANGVIDRYPNVKFVIPHCGSFLPNIAQRFEGITAILGPKGLMPDVDVKGNFAQLYFDTAGNPVPYLLDLLFQITTPDHVMYGSDHPYTPTPEKLKGLSALSDMLAGDEKYAGHADRIFYDNASALLGLNRAFPSGK